MIEELSRPEPDVEVLEVHKRSQRVYVHTMVEDRSKWDHNKSLMNVDRNHEMLFSQDTKLSTVEVLCGKPGPIASL